MARRHVLSRYIWNLDTTGTTGYYRVLPGVPGTNGKGILEQTSGSLAISANLHNSVALYRYLRVTPSLTMPLTTMH
eukprot:1325501-Amorphochlora_amoeboformis.AAC.1